MKTYVHIKTHMQTFIAVLFAISPSWKQSKYQWKNKSGKYIVIYPYNEIPLRYKKERTDDECNNINEPQIHYDKLKKLDKKVHTLIFIFKIHNYVY